MQPTSMHKPGVLQKLVVILKQHLPPPHFRDLTIRIHSLGNTWKLWPQSNRPQQCVIVLGVCDCHFLICWIWCRLCISPTSHHPSSIKHQMKQHNFKPWSEHFWGLQRFLVTKLPSRLHEEIHRRGKSEVGTMSQRSSAKCTFPLIDVTPPHCNTGNI